MTRIFLSLILGILPQALFFEFFVINIKGIKNKRFLLFILLYIMCILLNMIIRYNLYLYLLYTPLYYIIMKILYKKKTQIVDVFIIALSFAIMMTISALCSLIYKNNFNLYWIAYIVNNILLFSTLLFKKQFQKFYKFYCSNWNRKEGNKIRSITLRNISLISLNAYILILSIMLINILK
jgi:hypothetical protein